MRKLTSTAVALGAIIAVSGAAHAQTSATDNRSASVRATTGHPARDTLIRLSRKITIELQDQRLEDIMQFIKEYTGADFEVMWLGDRYTSGLDKDQTLSVKVDNVSALALLEKVLDKAQEDFDGNSWQFDKYGDMQVGPKTRLGRYRRVEIYDIYDLVLELPDYDQVPEIDLQQAIQQAQGGGGGGGSSQSPFEDDEDDDTERLTLEERAQEIMDLVTSLVEPEQWVENGGEFATIRHWNGTLIVNAPDFVHRQINGYRWWPSNLQTAGMTNGRRWVSMSMDVGNSTLDGFTETPVSAVVGGRIISSAPPPGGG
jgi:hypothetical protein